MISKLGVSSIVWGMRVEDSFVVETVDVLNVSNIKSFTVEEGKVVMGSIVVVPAVFVSVVRNVVEVVGFRVVVIQSLRLQDRSCVGAPKQGFPLGPVAATAKKRLRFCVPNPHVLLHLLHGPKSDHIQSTVHFIYTHKDQIISFNANVFYSEHPVKV